MACFCKLMTQNWHENFPPMRTWNWPRRCLLPPLSQRSCNHRYIRLDILSISCLAILRIFALDGIPSFPSNTLIVVGIPASRSRSVEFVLDRDLFRNYRTYENGVLSIPFRQFTPPPCHIRLSVNILIMDCNTKLL